MGENVGVATGVRAGKFSFSYNWRQSKDPLKNVLECIANPNSAAPFGSYVRELFETGASFEEVASAIEHAPMCGPAYAIVALPHCTQTGSRAARQGGAGSSHKQTRTTGCRNRQQTTGSILPSTRCSALGSKQRQRQRVSGMYYRRRAMHQHVEC
jgi:hypothetical protein